MNFTHGAAAGLSNHDALARFTYLKCNERLQQSPPHDNCVRSSEAPNELQHLRDNGARVGPVLIYRTEPLREADPTNLCCHGIHDGHQVVDAAQVLVRQGVHLKTTQQVAPDFALQPRGHHKSGRSGGGG